MNGMMLVQQRIDAIEARFGPPKSVATIEDAPAEDFGAMMAEITYDERSLRSYGSVSHGFGRTDSVGSASIRAPRIGGAPDVSPALRGAFEDAAARYGLDVDLLMAVAWQESGFNPGALSHAGAIGLMQLMPGTAAGLGVDPQNPLQNIDGGARYLRQQLDRFGSVELALAAYNAGPGAVQRHGGIPPFAETQGYVPAVIARWGRIAGGGLSPVDGALGAATAPSPSPTPAAATPASVANAIPASVANATPASAASANTASPDGATTAVAAAASGATITPTDSAIVPSTVDARAAVPAVPTPTGSDASTTPTGTPPAALAGVAAPPEGISAGLDQSSGGASQDSAPDVLAPASAVTGPSATTTPSSVSAVAPAVSTQEIPAEILRLVRQDGGVIRVQLSPQGLGDMSIHVSMTAAGEIAVEIMTDSDQAAVILGRIRESVESALRVEGFALDSFDVETDRERAGQTEDFSALADADGSESSGATNAESAVGGEGDAPATEDSVVDVDADDPSVLRI